MSRPRPERLGKGPRDHRCLTCILRGFHPKEQTRAGGLESPATCPSSSSQSCEKIVNISREG
eukprot:1045983-Amorphochlora_amoeboformis.AAC.1